ncbi:hypothetical protein DICPUDRAFT_6794, partial [Dictyostelium purpureum]
CKLCGSESFATSNDGSVVCTDCGTIKDSANIVSEISFGDNSSIVGTFVSATRRTGSSYRSLGGRDSRAMSLENARRRLDEIATSLKIRTHHIDSAQRSFELAMENNFTKGRKTKLVAASCLYVVCRREKTPHLLIDFSEVLQVNVFTLAHTFLQLIKLLNIQLPIVDPSLFIYRFSSSLEFGSQTKEVTATANKLVARMKRDWMCTGRKPSGICGAALYIASKIHGFKRSMKEIVHIVKIGESTLLARLEEFRRTPSASLRFSEFDEMEIEEECDPPSFTRNRLKEQLELEAKQKEQKEREKKEKKRLKRELRKKKKSKSEEIENEENEEEKEEKEEIEEIEEILGISYPPLPSEVDSSVFEPNDTLDDLSEDELDLYLEHDKETVKKKEVIWTELNKEWIEKNAERQREIDEDIKAGRPPRKRKQ